MKFTTAASFIVTFAVGNSVTDAEPSQLRGIRNLQNNGQPSVVHTEDDGPDFTPELNCTVLAADHLYIPEGHEGHVPSSSGRRLADDDGDIEFSCGFPDGTVADMSLSAEQRTDLEDAMTNGAIQSGKHHLNLAAVGATRSGSTVSFPPGVSIRNNAHSRGGARGNSASSSSRRKLAQLVGDKYTLVVKGVFVDYPFTAKSAQQISDDVFGGNGDLVNLKSQLEECSYGKLVTKPEPDPLWNNGALTSLAGIEDAPGVLEINMGVNMAGMTKAEIYNLFVTKTVEALGSTVTELPGPFDHVIFARETCLTECGWAAYAYINSWGQMFQGVYISQTGVQVHEMGHALNMAHSGSQGISWSGGSVGNGGYTDHTCAMGNPLYSDEIGKMCFNPAKNYQIDGWYNDAKLTLDPGGKNGAPDLPWEGNVVGVGEYLIRANNEPVTIKIETGTEQDYFVGFNRAAGPNADNDLADDKVNIIQVDGNDGVGYAQSQLRALLEPGGAYTEYAVPGIVDYADLKIKVNSIDSSATPWKANMRIGFDQCTDDQYCQDLAGGCFASTCHDQGTLGANVLGCINAPIPGCCGNDMCEGVESSTSCATDCLAGPITVQPDDCDSCWARDGAMFDVEAKPDADITITSVEYKAGTNSGNVRLYYRPDGKAGYASGSNLIDNGWIYVTQAAACGSWTFCSLGAGVNIKVDRGTKVGLLVAYDNGGNVYYYNNNFGPTSDEYVTVHEGAGVNFNLAGEYANSFHNSLMFSGKVTYMADKTNPFQCAADGDCDNGLYCDGAETCSSGSCLAGTAPSCSGDTPFCSEDLLGACVACLANSDCVDNDLCNGAETCNASGQCVAGTAKNCNDNVDCTVDFCTPSTGLCTNTPNNNHCDNGVFCDGAETCDALAGCQVPAENPCSGSTPFCDENNDQCLECFADADCDDSDMCTGVETCSLGACVPGTPVTCDDGVGCTVDACNPVDGTCSFSPDNTLCDNGLFCDGAETCNSVSDCQSGAAPTCGTAPLLYCSEALDSCAECVINGNCDNNEYCDGAETCNASGQCVAGTAPSCSGPTPFCSEALDECAECLFGADCNDGVACTDDVCSGGTCASTPNDANCPNAGEVCDASVGCQAQATVYACSKNAPTEAEACAAGSNADCDADPNVSCGNGGKVCHAFTCAVAPPPPPSPPSTPPPTPLSPPPPTPSCQSGGSCSGKCSNCCNGYSGSGGSKSCN